MELQARKLFDLEVELKSCEFIVNKVKVSNVYAQNLYAAFCNNQFVKNDVWPVLQDERWSCTWRYAGGIVADIRQEGDYLNWYCSGIGDSQDGYAGEGYVTDEIREDLLKLGWLVIEDGYSD